MSFIKKISANSDREKKCKMHIFLPETMELSAEFRYAFQESLFDKFARRNFDSQDDVDAVNDEIAEHVTFVLKHAIPSLWTFFNRYLREKSPYFGVKSITIEDEPKLIWQDKASPSELLKDNACVLKIEFFVMEKELAFDLQTIVENHPKP